MYVRFIYGYMHMEAASFRHGLSDGEHREFFLDHLTRKLYLEDPREFASAPAAIILFLGFLNQTGWLADEFERQAIEDIMKIRIDFMDMLRKHYS